MVSKDDFVELVRQAQHGEKVSLDRLCELSMDGLRAYIYRITLRHDLVEDLTQESMIEMIKFFIILLL